MKYLIILFVALICLSCDDARVFEKNLDVGGKNWYVDSVYQFDFQILETSLGL